MEVGLRRGGERAWAMARARAQSVVVVSPGGSEAGRGGLEVRNGEEEMRRLIKSLGNYSEQVVKCEKLNISMKRWANKTMIRLKKMHQKEINHEDYEK